MQFCKSHWDRLRKEITDAGMFHLVSKSGIQAAVRLVKDIKGQPTVPDPLMEAHNMISSRSIECMGIGMMNKPPDEREHYCPCCEADRLLPNHPNGMVCSEQWITSVIAFLKAEYTKEGWLNREN